MEQARGTLGLSHEATGVPRGGIAVAQDSVAPRARAKAG